MDYRIKREIAKCSLCHDAPCSHLCNGMDIGRIIRSLYFENTDFAASLLQRMLKKPLPLVPNILTLRASLVSFCV